MDAGDHALTRGLGTAFHLCVLGRPDLTGHQLGRPQSVRREFALPSPRSHPGAALWRV